MKESMYKEDSKSRPWPDSFHHVRSEDKVIHLFLNVLSQILHSFQVARQSKFLSRTKHKQVLQAVFNILHRFKELWNLLEISHRYRYIATSWKGPRPRPAEVAPVFGHNWLCVKDQGITVDIIPNSCHECWWFSSNLSANRSWQKFPMEKSIT